MGFHRLTVPTYSGGLRGGDDYINNAVSGTPAPAAGALSGGTYTGSYFVAQSEGATASALNRAHKALAENCDFLDDAIVAADGYRSRERTNPLSLTVFPATLTVDQQLVFLDSPSNFGKVTLPDPTTAAGRMFVLETSKTVDSSYRLIPFGTETINGGAAGGEFVLNTRGRFLVYTPDATNWLVGELPAPPAADHIFVTAVVPSTATNGDTVEIYGGGFRLVDAIYNNGLPTGPFTLVDDGRITYTLTGCSPGIDCTLMTLVIRDTEDPDYDGTTLRSASVAVGLTVT